MSSSLRRHAITAAALLALAPALAGADPCLITGPTTSCGATTQLCGPAGTFEYDWGGAGILEYDGQCVTVSVPGTYTLQTIDLRTGVVSSPCTITIAHVDAPTAVITGPSTGCTGTPLTLCGPDGGWTYAWSGPGGFSAGTACVDVVAAGDYTLVISDPAAGCVSSPVTQSVSFHDCTPPPPENCPRPASWWSQVCAGAIAGFGPDAFARVAACVDARAASIDWRGDADTACRALRPHPGDLRARALRQFAAVIANTCAGSASLPASLGTVALDPATPLALAGYSGTVDDWISTTDAELVALANRHGHPVNEAYRDVIRSAWAIDHGHGIGAVCAADSGMTLAGIDRSATTDESLAEELSDDSDVASNRLDVIENPAHGVARVSLALSEPANDVVVGVYDLTGRLVREIARGAYSAGAIELTWDGRDAAGVPVPNGVYFVQSRIGGVRTQSRLTLLR